VQTNIVATDAIVFSSSLPGQAPAVP